MPTSFTKELKQFALSVDIVNKAILNHVGNLLSDYFRNSLQANTYEVRVPVASGTIGERYLGTLWSCDGKRFTTPLHNIATIRLLNIRRNSEGKLNSQSLQSEILKRLSAVLGAYG